MGLEYSVFQIMEGAMVTEKTVIKPNGDTVTTKKNPLVAGIVIIGATGILITFMDGVKVVISKSFGRVCLSCSKNIQ